MPMECLLTMLSILEPASCMVFTVDCSFLNFRMSGHSVYELLMMDWSRLKMQMV